MSHVFVEITLTELILNCGMPWSLKKQKPIYDCDVLAFKRTIDAKDFMENNSKAGSKEINKMRRAFPRHYPYFMPRGLT